MEQSRFLELKDEMHLIREKDMQLSTKVDSKAINDESELNYSSSNYKKLKVEDLPIYRKWICGDMIQYYRGRIVDGRLICDKIHVGNNEVSCTSLTLSSVMAAANEESNVEEFDNAVSKLIKYLAK